MRAIAQLGVAALLIAAVVDSLPLSVALVCVMFAMGVLTTSTPGRGAAGVAWAALAMAAGVLPCVAVVLATGTIPAEGIALIPVAGIIVGNAMTAHTLVGRRAFAALREEHSQYEACLSLGLLPRQAIREIVHRRAPEALLPGLDQVKTTGVVTLPGAFIGVMLGGGTPAQAATAQVLVLFGIMAAQTVTVLVAEHLLAGRRLLLPTTSPRSPASTTRHGHRRLVAAVEHRRRHTRVHAAPTAARPATVRAGGAVAALSRWGCCGSPRSQRLAGPGRRSRRPVLRGRPRRRRPAARQHLQQRGVRRRRAGHRLAGRRRAARRSRRTPRLAAAYGVVVVLLGPASAAMHATQSALGGHLDLLSMYLVAAFAASYALTRGACGRGTGFFAVAFVAVVVVCELVERIPGHVPVVDIAANLAFGLFLLRGPRRRGGPVAARRRRGARLGWGFGVGRRRSPWPSRSGTSPRTASPLCHPDSLLQGHAAWHLLCAVGRLRLYRLYASERVSDAA